MFSSKNIQQILINCSTLVSLFEQPVRNIREFHKYFSHRLLKQTDYIQLKLLEATETQLMNVLSLNFQYVASYIF